MLDLSRVRNIFQKSGVLWECVLGRSGKEEAKKGGEIQEEIASGVLIRLWLIREWFADFSLAHQFALKVVLVLFDVNQRVCTGPSHFLPAELGAHSK